MWASHNGYKLTFNLTAVDFVPSRLIPKIYVERIIVKEHDFKKENHSVKVSASFYIIMDKNQDINLTGILISQLWSYLPSICLLLIKIHILYLTIIQIKDEYSATAAYCNTIFLRYQHMMVQPPCCSN